MPKRFIAIILSVHLFASTSVHADHELNSGGMLLAVVTTIGGFVVPVIISIAFKKSTKFAEGKTKVAFKAGKQALGSAWLLGSSVLSGLGDPIATASFCMWRDGITRVKKDGRVSVLGNSTAGVEIGEGVRETGDQLDQNSITMNVDKGIQAQQGLANSDRDLLIIAFALSEAEHELSKANSQLEVAAVILSEAIIQHRLMYPDFIATDEQLANYVKSRFTDLVDLPEGFSSELQHALDTRDEYALMPRASSYYSQLLSAWGIHSMDMHGNFCPVVFFWDMDGVCDSEINADVSIVNNEGAVVEEGYGAYLADMVWEHIFPILLNVAFESGKQTIGDNAKGIFNKEFVEAVRKPAMGSIGENTKRAVESVAQKASYMGQNLGHASAEPDEETLAASYTLAQQKIARIFSFQAGNARANFDRAAYFLLLDLGQARKALLENHNMRRAAHFIANGMRDLRLKNRGYSLNCIPMRRLVKAFLIDHIEVTDELTLAIEEKLEKYDALYSQRESIAEFYNLLMNQWDLVAQ